MSVKIEADQKQVITRRRSPGATASPAARTPTPTRRPTAPRSSPAQKDAFITTADLQVFAKATGTRSRDDATTGGGFIVFGGGDGSSTNNIKRHIDWESTTIMLGEPNPTIEIDANGKVVELVNITGHDGERRPARARRRRSPAPARSCSTTSSTTTTRGGAVRDRRVRAACRPSEIWGNAAIFDFQQTWDYVKIINESQHDIVVNDIDVVLPPGPNTIQINVKNVPNSDAVRRSARDRRRPGRHASTSRSSTRTSRRWSTILNLQVDQRATGGERLGHLPQRRHPQPDRLDQIQRPRHRTHRHDRRRRLRAATSTAPTS